MARPISAAIITKEDGEQLNACIEHLRDQVQEICVVDLGSGDNTIAAVRAADIKNTSYLWSGSYAAVRNEAIRLCHNDWVLLLYPNERLSPDVWAQLKKLPDGPHGRCYQFPVHVYTHVQTALTKDSGELEATNGFPYWYSVEEIRLFPKVDGLIYEGTVCASLEPAAKRLGIPIIRQDIPIDHYTWIKPGLIRIRTSHRSYYQQMLQGFRGDKTRPEGFRELGERCIKIKEWEFAVVAFSEAVRKGDHSPELLAKLGYCLYKTGFEEDARQILLLALRINPEFADAWKTLARIYVEEEKWHGAIECVNQVPEQIKAEWYEGYHILGKALEGEGHLEKAAEASCRAFRALPESKEVLRVFLHQMLNLKRRSEARDIILEAIEKGANAPTLHNAIGELFFYDNDIEKSIYHFREAVKMGLAAAANNLGVIFFRTQRFEEDRQAFEQCLQMDPNHQGARDNLNKLMLYMTTSQETRLK